MAAKPISTVSALTRDRRRHPVGVKALAAESCASLRPAPTPLSFFDTHRAISPSVARARTQKTNGNNANPGFEQDETSP